MDKNINIRLGENKNLILSTDFPLRIHFCQDKHVDLIKNILNNSVNNTNLKKYNFIINIIDLDTNLVKDSNIKKFNDFLNLNSVNPYEINYFVSIKSCYMYDGSIISSISNICYISDENEASSIDIYNKMQSFNLSHIIEKSNNVVYRISPNSKNSLIKDRINNFTIPFYNFKNFIDKKIIYWFNIVKNEYRSSIEIEKIDLTNKFSECKNCELRIFCSGFYRKNKNYCSKAINFFKVNALNLVNEIYEN